MSAYSVSGVGQGSAMKKGQKGAGDMYLGVERLIGTKVVFASTVVIGGGGTTAVTFPQALSGVAADYIVLSGGSANHSYATALTVNGFTMNGTATQTVSYAVIRVNNATVEKDI